MKKIIKTEDFVKAYNVLSEAKYGKLSDDDKIKVWKIVRKMKPIADKNQDAAKDAMEKLKPEGFDEKAQAYNETRDRKAAGIKDGLPMTDEEFVDFIYSVLNPYNRLLAKAAEEYQQKDIEIEFDPISEDAFKKLMNSNDWTMAEVMAVSEVAVE